VPTESEVDEPSYPIEKIPNIDSLFMRIHKNHFQQDEIITVAFKNHDMSTDWSKYSTPSDTQKRVKLNNKDPNNYGVISMNVGKVRNIDGQTVEHKPAPENRAHTEVIGEKITKVRVQFLRIFKWEIALENKD